MPERLNAMLLSLDEQRLLLEEIGTVALAVGRELYPTADFARLEAVSGHTPGRLTGREQIAFLESHLPNLERALRSISQTPRTMLQRRVMDTPLERAKFPTQRGILSAAKRGDLWSQTEGIGKVEEKVVEVTVDTPENRFIMGVLRKWRHDLKTIASFAEWEQETSLKEKAESLAQTFLRWETTLFPEIVQTQDIKVTNALLQDTCYRVVHEVWRKYRRLLVYAWEAPSLLLNPKEPWRLYEMWCFFRVVQAMRTLGFHALGGDVVKQVQGRLTVTLTKGQESRLVFLTPNAQHLTLSYNRAFPSARVGSLQASSRSHTMIPDMCLEKVGRFLLLDPKFRSYENATGEQVDAINIRVRDYEAIHKHPALYDDVNKMHAYKDAIVQNGQPVVDGAWCLYPGIKEGGQEIIAYPLSTPEQPFGTAGVGAIKLRPGESDKALVQLIAEWATR